MIGRGEYLGFQVVAPNMADITIDNLTIDDRPDDATGPDMPNQTDMPSPTGTAGQSGATTRIDLYWRPGCGFCSVLMRGLDKLGIERVEHNIWDDPAAAAIVRQHARGHETVPTVVVGDTALVNPSSRQLVSFLAEQAPHLLPVGADVPQPGAVGRLVGRVLGS